MLALGPDIPEGVVQCGINSDMPVTITARHHLVHVWDASTERMRMYVTSGGYVETVFPYVPGGMIR